MKLLGVVRGPWSVVRGPCLLARIACPMFACPDRLPGCDVRLPGSPARIACPDRLPGSPARIACPDRLPGGHGSRFPATDSGTRNGRKPPFFPFSGVRGGAGMTTALFRINNSGKNDMD